MDVKVERRCHGSSNAGTVLKNEIAGIKNKPSM